MGIPFRNTEFDNNPIGNDRPIYGNEKLPPSPTPTISVTPSITPTISLTPTITPSITPTISHTPTITPTNTLTPSPTFVCNCRSYSVSNTGTTSSNISYTDCGYVVQNETIPGGGGISFCACENTLSVGRDDVVSDLGPCSPLPSSTPPSSPTPTPTPSGYNYRYEVSNCDDPLDVRVFWSDDFYPIGKVVKGYNDVDLCFEIVGSSTLSPVDEVSTSYISCDSCPR